MVVDGLGNAWAKYKDGVARIAADGKTFTLYAVGDRIDFSGLAVDAAGNLWIAETRSYGLALLKPTGEVYLSTWRANGSTSLIAIDPAGMLWMVTAGYVAKIAPTGELLGKFEEGKDNNEIAIDSKGAIYLTQRVAHSVVKLTPDGQVEWRSTLKLAQYLAIDGNDNIWATNQEQTVKFDASGKALGTYPKASRFFAADRDGSYWSTKAEGLTKFAPDDTVLKTFPAVKNLVAIASNGSTDVWVIAGNGFSRLSGSPSP